MTDAELAKQIIEAIKGISGPPLWALLTTPSIIFLSVCAAFSTLMFSRSEAAKKRKSDTVVQMIKTEQESDFKRTHRTFSKYRRKNLLTRLNAPETDVEEEDRQEVLTYLNHYEIVALSIRHGLLDEEIYREWMGSIVVREWRDASDFIQADRWKLDLTTKEWVYHGFIWSNLQWLVSRFDESAVELDKDYSGPPAQ